MAIVLGPAHQLVGATLASGWQITQKLPRLPGSTGGTFGVGYLAEKDGSKAFVKAIDFVAAIKSSDPLSELQKLTGEANFERDAHRECNDHRMSKVVKMLAHEYYRFPGVTDPMQIVACLVLEYGDGDLRNKVTSMSTLRLSWILQVLRDVALGLDQLHRNGFAHQDVKPSNVISIGPSPAAGLPGMKLGDLGRVVRKGVRGPWDTLPWPGAHRYAPPERWYGFNAADWTDEREASDAFMLGSLLFFLLTGAPMQPLLFAQIPTAFQPANWRGGFVDSLIDVLRDAQARVIAHSLVPRVPADYVDELVAIAKALTEPDPRLRGDVKARKLVGRPVGIDRFHQRFRAAAIRAAVDERMGRI